MQYKKNVKIIIDKRKLDILLRLNCDKNIILDAIIYNKINLTGDELIDENLETLVDIKEFNNWGGKRNNSGRKKNNQVENQLENQLDYQEYNQVVDIDIDKDKDININKKIDKYINPYKNHFELNYKSILKSKPFLSSKDLDKIIELYSIYDEEIIIQALQKLKNIAFEGIDFKPSASWLLKDNNFERVMNGEFDKQKEEHKFEY